MSRKFWARLLMGSGVAIVAVLVTYSLLHAWATTPVKYIAYAPMGETCVAVARYDFEVIAVQDCTAFEGEKFEERFVAPGTHIEDIRRIVLQ